MVRDTGNSKRKTEADIELTVTEHGGLLEFLLRRLNGRSRNNVKSLLKNREVSVDGRVVTRHDYPLAEGQRVRIARSANRGERGTPLPILYEDEDLIVVNKPAGLLSVAAGHEKEKTAYHMLTDYVRRSDPKGRIFVVHRLDRETSGVLMAAKNERIKRALQDNWNGLVSQRGYIAVTEGKLKEKSGQVRSWLKQTKSLLVYSGGNEKDGLEAITNYRVIEENAGYSLVRIELKTGRKNQIRVHMKDIGNPVAGDHKYGAKTDPLRRLGLHAHRLELLHPFSGKPMCFEADAPAAFKRLFGKYSQLT